MIRTLKEIDWWAIGMLTLWALLIAIVAGCATTDAMGITEVIGRDPATGEAARGYTEGFKGLSGGIVSSLPFPVGLAIDAAIAGGAAYMARKGFTWYKIAKATVRATEGLSKDARNEMKAAMAGAVPRGSTADKIIDGFKIK